MATFKACVKAKRKDGFYPVYIRVIHHKKVAYIPTDKMVNDKGLSKSGEIEDPYVMQFCTNRIVEYMEILNRVDTEWKSHATLTLLAKQDCPLWLQYD